MASCDYYCWRAAQHGRHRQLPLVSDRPGGAKAPALILQACHGTCHWFILNTFGPSSPLPCSACAGAVSGIGVIAAFINQSLIRSVRGSALPILGQLVGLVLLLLVIALGSQLALTTLGPHSSTVAWPAQRQLLDTDVAVCVQIEMGAARPPFPTTSVRSPSPSLRLPELFAGPWVLTLGSISPVAFSRLARCYRPLGLVTMVVGWLEPGLSPTAHMRGPKMSSTRTPVHSVTGAKGLAAQPSELRPLSSTTSPMSRMPGTTRGRFPSAPIPAT